MYGTGECEKTTFIDIEQSGELADSESLIKQRDKKRGWMDGDWQLAPRWISFLSLFTAICWQGFPLGEVDCMYVIQDKVKKALYSCAHKCTYSLQNLQNFNSSNYYSYYYK